MKIVRFKAAGKTRYGILEGTHILAVLVPARRTA